MAASVVGARSTAGSMLSMTAMAAAAREGEGSTSTGGRGPLITQRPRDEPGSSMLCSRHNRAWLGTFKSEPAAAASYDSADVKLHGGDSRRNLPWNEVTVREPRFQEQFSTEAVLKMIKSEPYESRFAEYLQLMQSPQASVAAPLRGFLGSGGGGGIFCEMLFTKELAPSDVREDE
ncbi:AP2/ERF and B3 domain-containing transcription factor At1g51120-like [Phoenix dactylifera]|uniref:AP2/ERF and B3 domain-containing transcription factor At1g51120-like n=1 Tax=Phoenix dactylifera TaxID=42345 RepID=A0A8B7BLC1_PHODC|nr:AP2/ERF and B3 domain-containing transcription factor At1g51120-like [Phoenix dactylifera]